MFDPITYRYKRTLAEAFPCDAASAIACTKHRPALYKRIVWAICDYGTVLAIGLGLAYGFFYGWSLL